MGQIELYMQIYYDHVSDSHVQGKQSWSRIFHTAYLVKHSRQHLFDGFNYKLPQYKLLFTHFIYAFL